MEASEHSPEHNMALPVEVEIKEKPTEVLQPQPQEATYSILEFQPGQVPKDYRNFIYSHWLHTARYGNPVYKRIPSLIYYNTYEKYVATLLDKTRVRLAVLDEDKDVLLGFACYEMSILHYVFVLRDQRGQGIGRKLASVAGLEIYTHYTKSGEQIVKKKMLKLMFNPFM